MLQISLTKAQTSGLHYIIADTYDINTFHVLAEKISEETSKREFLTSFSDQWRGRVECEY